MEIGADGAAVVGTEDFNYADGAIANQTGGIINLWVDPANDSAPVASQDGTLTDWSTAVRFCSGGQTTWDMAAGLANHAWPLWE